MYERSYVCPSAAVTGSRHASWEMESWYVLASAARDPGASAMWSTKRATSARSCVQTTTGMASGTPLKKTVRTGSRYWRSASPAARPASATTIGAIASRMAFIAWTTLSESRCWLAAARPSMRCAEAAIRCRPASRAAG